MLKIATIVRVLPIPMRLRREEKVTMSQTELSGVRVVGLMREKNLFPCYSGIREEEEKILTWKMGAPHHEKKHMPSLCQPA
jgi:hypothetical protein